MAGGLWQDAAIISRLTHTSSCSGGADGRDGPGRCSAFRAAWSCVPGVLPTPPSWWPAVQDPAVRQWNRLLVETPEDARRRIDQHVHERWRAELSAIWAIARPEGEAVGLIGWGDIDLGGGSAEIVYWMLPSARGGGVVAEATKRVSEWALKDLGVHRLRLCHSVANPASCRVADKAGYTLEGTMRSALLHADGWHDEHLHALVQGDI
ncbi:hypothetical protein STANM309S_04110 [Streptomyces tanashiensis]